VEVNDVDALRLREDVRSHMRVPLALEVTEVDTCFQQLLEIRSCHVYFPGLSNPAVVGLNPPSLDTKRLIKK
jgi:hypothetical protein